MSMTPPDGGPPQPNPGQSSTVITVLQNIVTAINGLAQSIAAAVTRQIPVFGPSGTAHSTGLVPDPGSVAGTSRFLREDATFATPAGSGTSPNQTLRSNISGAPAVDSDNTLTGILDNIIGTARGDIIVRGASAWAALALGTNGQVLASNGTDLAYASSSGAFISFQVFAGSTTITIPAGATKGLFWMWGGTGGSGGSNSAAQPSGGTGAAGFLIKYLTGLTPGNTLAWTQGAAGAAGASTPGAGGNGGASTLASGTQTITTLTANGSNGSAAAATGANLGTAGGTATNGDLNITGIAGGTAVAGNSAPTSFGIGGGSLFAPGTMGVSGVATAGNAGRAGGLLVLWFA